MRLRRSHRTLAFGAAVAVLIAGIPPSTASPRRPPGPRQPSAAEKAVTLITGDRVLVSKRGEKWQVRIEPARRLTAAPGGYFRHAGPEGVTVIPTAAAPLVRSGVLDRALFDVTGLIRQGYDDARTTELPLLVTGSNHRSAPRQAVTRLGRVTRELPAARLVAVSTAKDRSGKVFDALIRDAGNHLTLAAGLGKVWLNGNALPTLDASVAQVGAPAAWRAGFTGRGAKVAVLDTGYDPAHPDLTGVVAGDRDFTGDPAGIRDTVGHGTHVAAAVAGRGAASNGRYVGVAKEANLLVGKVCRQDGCPYDAIVAGMQWAAQSGARVVNMSLGGWATDGTDPLSMELNRLTAEHGALFVVAAGNSGQLGEQVSNPASADAALAVGSVSKQDEASDFSSAGPRFGDFAVKPDIAAPGEQIVAARAAGTLDDQAVDEHHARLSGTSMATPHVAGAAAILAAQHPDWRADQLKAALMNSAHPVAASVYKQGAGRLDVARAVRQQVTASPASISFGYFRWPHDAATPVSRRITYHNDGSAPLSLSLRVEVSDGDGRPVPTGMFRTDTDQVTVPPHGAAAVTATVDPQAGPIGTHGGRVVATSTDGGTVVQTAVGAYKEPESYDLTLRMVDRNGAPTTPENGIAMVVNLDEPSHGVYGVVGNEPVRLRAGRYAVLSYLATQIPGRIEQSLTAVAEPEVSVRRNTTVHLDARKGKRVGIQVDAKDARIAAAVNAMVVMNDRVDGGYYIAQVSDMYAVPTKGSHPHFFYYDRAQLQRPLVRLKVTAPESFEVPVEWAPNSPETTDTRTLPTVDVGHARPEEIGVRDVRGKLAVFTLGAGEEDEYDVRVRALGQAGAAAALFYFSEPIRVTSGDNAPMPVTYTLKPEGARLARLAATSTATVTLAGSYGSPYRYELAFPSFGRIPADLARRPRNRDLGAVRTSYHGIVDGGVGYVDYHPTSSGALDMGSALWSNHVRLPTERIEYYSPGILWGSSLRVAPDRDGSVEHGYLSAVRTYRAGERLSVTWNKAVFGPALSVSPGLYNDKPHLAFRDGDTIDTLLPLFSDAYRHTGVTRPEDYSFADEGDTSLYVDGGLVGHSGIPGEGIFTAPAAAGRYRLVSEVTRQHPAWPLATRVGAEWTFESSHTDRPTPLPLLTIGFDPRLDLNNYAPAGRRFAIPVTVARQPGSTGGRTVLRTVEISYDDGTTWHRVRVHQAGQGWSVTVANPRSGFVSLRASAHDAAGNTVTQTIIRAYRIG